MAKVKGKSKNQQAKEILDNNKYGYTSFQYKNDTERPDILISANSNRIVKMFMNMEDYIEELNKEPKKEIRQDIVVNDLNQIIECWKKIKEDF